MFKKTIESVMFNFTKMVSDLQSIAEGHHKEYVDQTNKAFEANLNAKTAQDNRDIATKLAGNITNLLN